MLVLLVLFLAIIGVIKWYTAICVLVVYLALRSVVK